MLADPQSITVNAVAQSLPRTVTGVTGNVYANADESYLLTTAYSSGKRKRKSVRIDANKISTDPLVPSQNQKVSMSAYLVIDSPITGYTATEIKHVVDALTKWLTDSSGANLVKVIGGEP